MEEKVRTDGPFSGLLGARHAFMLLGLMTMIVFIGGFFALSKKAEAPVEEPNNATSMSLTLTSPAFVDGGTIPSRFTCDGDNINPELTIGGVPKEADALVLVMDDPDIPESVKQARGIEVFDHWVLYNLPSTMTVIPEGSVRGALGSEGLNSVGKSGYIGPCPPDREHRYIFRLYAIKGTLNFVKTPTLKEVEDAAKGMSLAETTLTGRYERTDAN